MKNEKMLRLLYIAALAVAFFDLAFIIFTVIEVILVATGTVFLLPSFWILALIIIIINTALLGYIGVYFLIRSKSEKRR